MILQNDLDKNYNILRISNDWEHLSEKEFKKNIDNLEPYEIGYFLAKQSDENYKILLEKYDCLTEEIDIMPLDGLYHENFTTCKFYEFCNKEYKLYADNLTISGAPNYTTTR